MFIYLHHLKQITITEIFIYSHHLNAYYNNGNIYLFTSLNPNCNEEINAYQLKENIKLWIEQRLDFYLLWLVFELLKWKVRICNKIKVRIGKMSLQRKINI